MRGVCAIDLPGKMVSLLATQVSQELSSYLALPDALRSATCCLPAGGDEWLLLILR